MRNQASGCSFGSGVAAEGPETGPGGNQVQTTPAFGVGAMAPTSGGSRYHKDLRRRLAVMWAALLHEDGSSDPGAAVKKREWCQVWGCDQAPQRSTSDWVEVDVEFQRHLREVLWGSGAEPGLMAILASRRARQAEQRAELNGMFMHGFRLRMPLSMLWFPGWSFGAAPLETWCETVSQAEQQSKACADGVARPLLFQDHRHFSENLILHTTDAGEASAMDALYSTELLESPACCTMTRGSDDGTATPADCQDSDDADSDDSWMPALDDLVEDEAARREGYILPII